MDLVKRLSKKVRDMYRLAIMIRGTDLTNLKNIYITHGSSRKKDF